MTFTKTESKRYRYVFDLNAFPTKEYKSIYEQLGWVFVGKMASFFIWRKEYSSSRPESFTDRESLIKRNQQVINALTACFAVMIIAAAGLWTLIA